MMGCGHAFHFYCHQEGSFEFKDQIMINSLKLNKPTHICPTCGEIGEKTMFYANMKKMGEEYVIDEQLTPHLKENQLHT
jgi:thymidine kinase